MGGDIGRGRSAADTTTGGFAVFSCHPATGELELVVNFIGDKRPSGQWISDVKWSPDGRTLALGSHDCAIHYYSCRHDEEGRIDFVRMGSFAKHSSYITHFDFSACGKFVKVS